MISLKKYLQPNLKANELDYTKLRFLFSATLTCSFSFIFYVFQIEWLFESLIMMFFAFLSIFYFIEFTYKYSYSKAVLMAARTNDTNLHKEIREGLRLLLGISFASSLIFVLLYFLIFR